MSRAAACLSSPSKGTPRCRSRRRCDSTAATVAVAAAFPVLSSSPMPTTARLCSTSLSCSSPRPLPPLLNAHFARARSSTRSSIATRALAPDAPPDWTLDQIAGLVFGLGMVASVLLAYKVDSAVARQQRRDLGLCEVCGGLNEKGTCSEKNCPRR